VYALLVEDVNDQQAGSKTLEIAIRVRQAPTAEHLAQNVRAMLKPLSPHT
jgi:hypothetical protein